MSTVAATPQLPAVITGKFNISLTEGKFQQLADEAAALVYNEDNLEKIKEFLTRVRKGEKAIEETHKLLKADALQFGRDCDAGKNAFLGMYEGIKSKPLQEYTRMCEDIQKRIAAAAQEKLRVDSIQNGIESNAILFAKQIADCSTTLQLTAIESKINLEKTRKEKYQEFLPDAVKRFTELNTILAHQKKTVKQLEENARLQEEAKKANDDAALLKLKEEQEQQEAQIEENKTVVQETAIQQSVNATPVQYAQEIIPTIKARRTTWTYEVVNEKEVMKKSPELVIFTLDKDKVKAMQKTLKDSGQLDGKTEFVINGIRFFEEKTY